MLTTLALVAGAGVLGLSVALTSTWARPARDRGGASAVDPSGGDLAGWGNFGSANSDGDSGGAEGAGAGDCGGDAGGGDAGCD